MYDCAIIVQNECAAEHKNSRKPSCDSLRLLHLSRISSTPGGSTLFPYETERSPSGFFILHLKVGFPHIFARKL